MMLQPYGALFAGCVAGTVATLGYQVVQPALDDRLNINDSCGVHNLHGMPGVLGGLLSVLAVWLATPEIYGPALYLIVGNMAPEEGTEALAKAQAELPSVEAGPGYTASHQAGIQMTVLGISLAVSVIGGLITGIIINIPFLTSTMHDGELYDDFQFFDGVDESEPYSKDLLTPEPPPESRRVSFAPTYNGKDSTMSTELNDRRSSMVSNGDLAEYYRRVSALSYQANYNSQHPSPDNIGLPNAPTAESVYGSQAEHLNYGYEQDGQYPQQHY